MNFTSLNFPGEGEAFGHPDPPPQPQSRACLNERTLVTSRLPLSDILLWGNYTIAFICLSQYFSSVKHTAREIKYYEIKNFMHKCCSSYLFYFLILHNRHSTLLFTIDLITKQKPYFLPLKRITWFRNCLLLKSLKLARWYIRLILAVVRRTYHMKWCI